MQRSFILPVVAVMTIYCTACSKKNNSNSPQTAPITDSSPVHFPTQVSPYPYTDTFLGNLHVDFEQYEPSSAILHTDTTYFFYVVHPSQDTIIFKGAGPLKCSPSGGKLQFDCTFRVNDTGVYAANGNKFTLYANSLNVVWYFELKNARVTSGSYITTKGNYSGDIVRGKR